MLNGNNDSLLNYYYNNGPEIGLYNNHLTIRSISFTQMELLVQEEHGLLKIMKMLRENMVI